MSKHKSIDRAFNQACASAAAAASAKRESKAASAAEEPEQAPDAIKRILDAWDKKDFFRLLLLPEPTADDLGRPEWACSATDVSKAYRKLSVLVHPDKNPGVDARNAFEALNVRAWGGGCMGSEGQRRAASLKGRDCVVLVGGQNSRPEKRAGP